MRSIPLRPAIYFCALFGVLSIFAFRPASADTTVGGTISTDTTWTMAGSPYIVTSNITVKGTDGADGITTLSIDAGVEIRFGLYRQLSVGASSGDPGALVAQGTSANPVVFTSGQASPAPGNWYGLKFYNTTDDATTNLSHCLIRYAGYGNKGAVYVYNAAPVLSNCTIESSSNYDLYYAGDVGGSVTDSTLNSGISLLTNTSSVIFTGNTLNQNNSYPTKTYADNVGSLVNGNTFANLDNASYLEINTGNVTRDATWNDSIPLYLNSNTTIKGTDGADGVTTLTIEPGAELRFGLQKSLSVGASSGDPGALVAQGTSTSPIIFTSSQTAPAPGDWGSIKFYNTTDDATTKLIYCLVQYGGYGGWGLVYIYNAKPLISNSNFKKSVSKGIYFKGSGCNDAEITGNIFTENDYGVYCTGNALPLIHQNNFTGNTSYGLYNTSSTAVNAENNWWGDPAGPNAGGDATYGNVDVDPWLTEQSQVAIALDYPDLIVTALVSNPAGNLQSGQEVTLTANLHNMGSGRVAGSFGVDFRVDGSSIGEASVSDTIEAGDTLQISHSWTCTGGDPMHQIVVDSQSDIAEINETNNTFAIAWSDMVDNAAPALVSTSPSDLEQVTQLDQISVVLQDEKGIVNDAAVISSFLLIDANQQNISGTVTENNDTFVFAPDNLPLPQGTYQVSLNSTDTHGNTQSIVFSFEIIPEPTLVSGAITTDTVWTLDNSPYIVTSSITVQGSDGADGVTTLTIEPGVEVRFNRYHYLSIGSSTSPGALVAQGTTANPIVFTANQTTPSPGDWQAILINDLADDATTKLEHCIVEYTGNYNKGAIYIQDAAPTIADCIFRNGSYYDLNFSGTVGGSVSGCTLNNGIRLQTPTSSVVFSANTINYNNGFPIIAYPDSVHDLVNGNTFNNINPDSYLEVRSGPISRDATWTAMIPYYIDGGISVEGTDGADGITILTIEPGARLRFDQGRYLAVGTNGPGALVAQGAAGSPIVFTSSQPTPAPGDWHGILIYDSADDAATVLEHCVVEYAGSMLAPIYLKQTSPTLRNVTVRNSKTYGVYMDSSAPTFDNCTFINNQNYDLYYTGTIGGSVSGCTFNSNISLFNTGVVEFSGNTINYNNALPIVLYPDSVHGLVNGCTFHNVDANSFLDVRSGIITRDAIWTADIPIFINGYLDFDGTLHAVTIKGTDGPDGITTLTLAPGARLKFNNHSFLDVGSQAGDPGALVGQGTADQPIVFTSNAATPAPGDWIGVRIFETADDATTLLEHCTFEYTGDYDNGAVFIRNASPRLNHCIFDNSGYYDLLFRDTVGGNVENCTINNGIYFQNAISTVEFNNNTINYNNNRPIIASADGVHTLVHGNTYTNINTESIFQVGNSSLTRDATWTPLMPYVVINGLTVQGTDGQDGVTTLTLEPGVKLKINYHRFLDVGAAYGEPGALRALGTEAQPVVLTSNTMPQAAGDWFGIRIYNTADDASTRLEHCLLENGGFYVPGFDQGAVLIRDAAPTLVDCTFSNSQGYDLYYTGTVGGAVSGCTFNHNISLKATGFVDFDANTFHHTNIFPTRSYPENVHSLVNGNSYTNLDAASFLQVIGGTIARDATWTAAIPLHIDSQLTVQGTDGADGVTTLTIEPGTRLKFGSGGVLNVGGTSGDPGALIAQGTPDNMILFTTQQATRIPGAWDAVRFNSTAAQNSKLEYCVVEYGGYYDQGGVFLNFTKAAVRNCIIRNNKTYGMDIKGTESNGADISCNSFESNGTGIHTSFNALPDIHHNNFINNSLYGIRGSGLTAENNWWNDPDGPNQSGDKSHDETVDVDPWSMAPNQCITAGINQQPYTPAGPNPADHVVQVTASSDKTLTWYGGDPNPEDVVVYDVRIGTTAENLTLEGINLTGPSFVLTDPVEGVTYFWQVTARDNHGLETTGPLWQFTTIGDYPDLVISSVSTDPGGNLQAGQSVTLNATVQNVGDGPVVHSFTVEFTIDGTLLGTSTIDDIMLSGEGAVISKTWTYNGGDPTIEISADSRYEVDESNDQNNKFIALVSQVADMTAPTLVGSAPTGDSYMQQVNSIAVTLVDGQSAVDDDLVMASIAVTGAEMQTLIGSTSEADDTFTFSPAIAPMADGTYTVSLTAADIHGNTQSYDFVFTVDSQPPGEPMITGGQVASGTIQARPVQNVSNQFVAELTGTRESGTSVWFDGIQQAMAGDTPWSFQTSLEAGDNALEVWLVDRAGNQGPSVWVDIRTATTQTMKFDYDAAGRVQRIHTTP